MKRLLFAVIMFSFACTPVESVTPDLVLKKTTLKQGEFFQALVRNVKEQPRVWFNTQEYKMYRVDDPEQWLPVDAAQRIEALKYKSYRALIPVENLTKPDTYSVLARLDDWEERIQVEIEDNGKGISHITLSDDKSGISATAKELNIVGSSLRTQSYRKLWEGKFLYPSQAAKSSPFGVKRSYNGGPVDSYHKGLDFAGNMGSPVYAPANAKVIATGKEVEGFAVHGNTILLDHGHALTSIYMHLSKIEVAEGDTVTKGQKIGEVGHTGISTGPHLHWGTYLYGTSVEPEVFVNEEVL